jgi:hypothetical protein
LRLRLRLRETSGGGSADLQLLGFCSQSAD